MIIEDQDAMRWEIEVASKRAAGEKIVHGLVKLDAHGRILVIEEEINARVFLLAHGDLHGVRHFEKGL